MPSFQLYNLLLESKEVKLAKDSHSSAVTHKQRREYQSGTLLYEHDNVDMDPENTISDQVKEQ